MSLFSVLLGAMGSECTCSAAEEHPQNGKAETHGGCTKLMVRKTVAESMARGAAEMQTTVSACCAARGLVHMCTMYVLIRSTSIALGYVHPCHPTGRERQSVGPVWVVVECAQD